MKEKLVSDKNIQNKIYEIRGKQVMLDSDLAKLYECKNGTKTINQAVGRHLDRFPEDFYFQLTSEEYYDILRSQIGTLELEQGKYSKYLPYAFTEQGIAMLSSVIRTDAASQVNISIMRAFVSMKHYLYNNRDVYQILNYINNKINEHDEKLNELFIGFTKKEKLFFAGDVYVAYSYVHGIFKDSVNDLIIIDPYADLKLLDILVDVNVKIKLITSNKSKLTKAQIDLFNKQFDKLYVLKSEEFHDRYFIIDKKILYHVGTSINSIGKKVFNINLIEDKYIRDKLLDYIQNIIDK